MCCVIVHMPIGTISFPFHLQFISLAAGSGYAPLLGRSKHPVLLLYEPAKKNKTLETFQNLHYSKNIAVSVFNC